MTTKAAKEYYFEEEVLKPLARVIDEANALKGPVGARENRLIADAVTQMEGALYKLNRAKAVAMEEEAAAAHLEWVVERLGGRDANREEL